MVSMEQTSRIPKVRRVWGVVVIVLMLGATIGFVVWVSSLVSQPVMTITGSGYVIDAPDISGQMYIQQGDGPIRIIVPGE